MQSEPIVSQFLLHSGHPVQHLARSRFKESHGSTFAKSSVGPIFTPQQTIVNVKLPQPAPNSPSPLNIRTEIDACLDAIESVYSHRRSRPPQQNFIADGVRQEQAIHRIDSNIVMNYVSTVYRDYKIRDRFGSFHPAQVKKAGTEQAEPVRAVQARERASSLNRPSTRTQKQFLNVTQESRLIKPEGYFSSNRINKNNTHSTKQDHQRTFSFQTSPPNPTSIRLQQTTTKKSELFDKVMEDFRFCVNCERSILSINVDFHEQYECPGFQSLYRLSFKELSQVVEEKVRRIRGELKAKLLRLKEKDGQGRSKMQTIGNTMLTLMEDYVKEERSEILKFKDQVVEEQRRLKFNMFKQGQNNEYSEAVELTHKLHWLQQIWGKLRREEANTQQPTKKQEIKPIQMLRLSTPRNPKTSSAEQSPIVYLHPHLHKYAKQ